eukprot:TRINITY_DN7084_c0_g1_i1.p1 TRINITY_DN7084_c0_g1~~TRINITY_DN7084_c0_g1_i1.p1  ORF type:complete len:479 (+),score=57.77 TRINITY_DN7084_c0_g1_i1:1-1437(+)
MMAINRSSDDHHEPNASAGGRLEPAVSAPPHTDDRAGGLLVTPAETWTHIFAFVDLRTLGCLSCVCCQFHDIAQQPHLWQKHFASAVVGKAWFYDNSDQWRSYSAKDCVKSCLQREQWLPAHTDTDTDTNTNNTSAHATTGAKAEAESSRSKVPGGYRKKQSPFKRLLQFRSKPQADDQTTTTTTTTATTIISNTATSSSTTVPKPAQRQLQDAVALPRKHVRIAAIGPRRSGKTCLLTSYVIGQFVPDYRPSNDRKVWHKQIKVDDTEYDVDIVDVGADCRVIATRGCGFLIVYSVSAQSTFQDIASNYLEQLRLAQGQDLDNIPFFLVGSTSDLDQEVPTEDAHKLATSFGSTHVQVSSIVNRHIASQVFEQAIRRVDARYYTEEMAAHPICTVFGSTYVGGTDAVTGLPNGYGQVRYSVADNPVFEGYYGNWRQGRKHGYGYLVHRPVTAIVTTNNTAMDSPHIDSVWADGRRHE